MWPFKKKPLRETQWRVRKTDRVGMEYYVLEVQDYMDAPTEWRFVKILTDNELAAFTKT